MTHSNYVSDNLKYLSRIFDLSYEEMAERTTLPVDKIKQLEVLQDDKVLASDHNLTAVCFICNFFAIQARDFVTESLVSDTGMATNLADLKKEIKENIPFDRSSFYKFVTDSYKQTQKTRESIKPTSFGDAAERVQALLIDLRD